MIDMRTIDDTHAIRLVYDPDARDYDNPLDWPGDALESTVIDCDRRIDPAYYTRGDDPEVGMIVARNQGAALETALERHYARRGWTSTVISLTGPTQSDWIRLFVATDPKRYCPAESFARGELTAWWRGDVYGIESLHLVTWTADDGRIRTEWEPIDAIGDVYLVDGEDWTVKACDLLGVNVPPARS